MGKRPAARRVALAHQAKEDRRQARQSLGRLKGNGIKPATLSKYTKYMNRFSVWATGRIDFELPTYLQLGDWLQEYIEGLWQEGEPKSWATLTLAAVQHSMPSSKRRLSGAWRTKSAWGRIQLPSRVPR